MVILNILQISRENTCGICQIFKNTYSEKHKRTAASMVRLFRKVFQMQSSWYSSRLKALINRVFVFPGPRLFPWTPDLALAPNWYLPALAPNLYFLALAPNLYLPALTQFVFSPNLYLPAQPGLSLHIPTLSPQFVFTGPGLWFVRTQAAKLIYPQWCWIM